jgi:biotin carboxylase
MDRLLLLLPTTTYRTQAFLDAARKLGVEIVCASERPNVFEERAPDNLLTLDFGDPAGAAAEIAELHRTRPLRAVVAVDDTTTVVASAIAARLGLKANSVASAAAARDKLEMRRRLRAAAVPQPRYWPVALEDDPARAARQVVLPCVLKPLSLSASRGVIRADDVAQFVDAFHRIAAILRRDDVAVTGDAARLLLAEEFVPGGEVALEGLLCDGDLRTLAVFDKPDPLDGPFFEETIYVTPSRLPDGEQKRIADVTAAACAALGLTEGPVHAELRVNERGPWILEVAARSIGGLCSRTLRFGTGMSLEELILRRALGWPIASMERDARAAGVMMIPIPGAGRLWGVRGQGDAEQVACIEEVAITAHLDQELMPLPEGWQYLGFIFARGATPAEVEHALRVAHAKLTFDIGAIAERAGQ